MSTYDDILLCTGLSKDDAELKIVEAVGLRNDGGLKLHRPVNRWPDVATVWVDVDVNIPDDSVPFEESSIYDAPYDIQLEISVTGWREAGMEPNQLQREEASAIFTEITEKLGYPAAHTRDTGLIFSAWDPVLGRTDFPEGTGFDAEGEGPVLWEPYSRPRPPEQ